MIKLWKLKSAPEARRARAFDFFSFTQKESQRSEKIIAPSVAAPVELSAIFV